MNRKFLSLITVLATLWPQSIYNKPKNFMIAASPSSGSSFLKRIIVEKYPEKSYKSEFFTEIFSSELVKYFTNSLSELQIPVNELHIENYYKQAWKPNEYLFTKEVFVHAFIPFLNEKFFITTLYRHRKFTFPTRKDVHFKKMYGIFINAPYTPDSFFYKIQTFLKKEARTPIEKNCAAHIIFNYILFKFCIICKLPIINYENLITFNQAALKKYLKLNLPDFIFSPSMATSIINNRKEPPFLQKKEQVYQELGVEPFCQELITFIKKLDPDMPYWHLLE